MSSTVTHPEPSPSVTSPIAGSVVPGMGHERLYDARFAAAYLSNTCLLIAVGFLFRYADFVKALGGDEGTLGWITGVGTAGAVVMRLIQGDAIDRVGARIIWIIAMIGYSIGLASHLLITSVDGPWIYLTSLLMSGCLSGAFGASITHVSLRAPKHRVTEILGTLGSSGFVGMALGPALGDWVYGWGMQPGDELDSAVRLLAVRRLFVAAIIAAIASTLLVFLATAGEKRVIRKLKRRPPSWLLLRRYHPGRLLLVAVAMGAGIGLIQVFVRPFAEHLSVANLRVFFITYASTAFTIRMATRTWHATVGERRMIIVGLSALAMAMLSFLPVTGEWGLVVPALVAGFAHALLFPSVVSTGCAAFPSRYRGLASTLVLACFDLGNLIGRPLCGQVVVIAKDLGYNGFAVMFASVAIGLALVIVVFIWPVPSRRRRRLPFGDTQRLNGG